MNRKPLKIFITTLAGCDPVHMFETLEQTMTLLHKILDILQVNF